VFVALIMNMVRVSNSDAVPVMAPVEVSNTKPEGRLGLIVQEIISPCPDNDGARGRSTLDVLLVIVKSSGEYVTVGI